MQQSLTSTSRMRLRRRRRRPRPQRLISFLALSVSICIQFSMLLALTTPLAATRKSTISIQRKQQKQRQRRMAPSSGRNHHQDYSKKYYHHHHTSLKTLQGKKTSSFYNIIDDNENDRNLKEDGNNNKKNDEKNNKNKNKDGNKNKNSEKDKSKNNDNKKQQQINDRNDNYDGVNRNENKQNAVFEVDENQSTNEEQIEQEVQKDEDEEDQTQPQQKENEQEGMDQQPQQEEETAEEFVAHELGTGQDNPRGEEVDEDEEELHESQEENQEGEQQATKQDAQEKENGEKQEQEGGPEERTQAEDDEGESEKQQQQALQSIDSIQQQEAVSANQEEETFEQLMEEHFGQNQNNSDEGGYYGEISSSAVILTIEEDDEQTFNVVETTPTASTLESGSYHLTAETTITEPTIAERATAEPSTAETTIAETTIAETTIAETTIAETTKTKSMTTDNSVLIDAKAYNDTLSDQTSLDQNEVAVSSPASETTYTTSSPTELPIALSTHEVAEQKESSGGNDEQGRENDDNSAYIEQNASRQSDSDQNFPVVIGSHDQTALAEDDDTSNIEMDGDELQFVTVEFSVLIDPNAFVTAGDIIDGKEMKLMKTILLSTMRILCEETDFYMIADEENPKPSNICVDDHGVVSRGLRMQDYRRAEDAGQQQQTPVIVDAPAIFDDEDVTMLLADPNDALVEVLDVKAILKDRAQDDTEGGSEEGPLVIKWLGFAIQYDILRVGRTYEILSQTSNMTGMTADALSPREEVQRIAKLAIEKRINDGSLLTLIQNGDTRVFSLASLGTEPVVFSDYAVVEDPPNENETLYQPIDVSSMHPIRVFGMMLFFVTGCITYLLTTFAKERQEERLAMTGDRYLSSRSDGQYLGTVEGLNEILAAGQEHINMKESGETW